MYKSLKYLTIGFLSVLLLFASYAYPQVNYPYSSGQAVFVQSPYNSSLYTNYDFNSREGGTNRLPAYTTNQAVFVQRPYMSQQTVAAYPSSGHYGLSRTESRYTSPVAFPSTVAPAYPYGTTASMISGQYTTTAQTPSYTYPYQTSSYITTSNYPYTSTVPTVSYPGTVVKQAPTPVSTYPNGSGTYNTYRANAYNFPTANSASNGYPANTYNSYTSTAGYPTTTQTAAPSAVYNNAYPVTTIEQYPYPVTTTGAPESVIQPAPPPRPAANSSIYR